VLYSSCFTLRASLSAFHFPCFTLRVSLFVLHFLVLLSRVALSVFHFSCFTFSFHSSCFTVRASLSAFHFLVSLCLDKFTRQEKMLAKIPDFFLDGASCGALYPCVWSRVNHILQACFVSGDSPAMRSSAGVNTFLSNIPLLPLCLRAAMMPCFRAAMGGHDVVMLCCYAVVLLGHAPCIFAPYRAAMLLCCYAVVLLFCCDAMMLCCCAAILL